VHTSITGRSLPCVFRLIVAFIFVNAHFSDSAQVSSLHFCSRLKATALSKTQKPIRKRERVDASFCAEKDRLPMNRLTLTALAAACVLVACAQTASANDNPLAFYSQPNPQASTAPAVSATGSRVQRSVPRSIEGPAAADVAKIADQMGVPRGLALSVCRVETKCRYGLVGRAGERGPLQIKLQTARGLGYSGGATGLDGYNGAYWGMKHLQVAYEKCGNARGAARLHNAGLASSCGGSHYASRVVAGL
jgi:soluble lytic murein transglycosylase-like protein